MSRSALLTDSRLAGADPFAPRNGGTRPLDMPLGTNNVPPQRAGIYHSGVKFSVRSHFFGDAKYFLRFDL